MLVNPRLNVNKRKKGNGGEANVRFTFWGSNINTVVTHKNTETKATQHL